jgi:iron complex outermembrane receptor protein
MKLTYRTLPRFAVAALLLTGSSYLMAQDEDDEIYELSPFTVDSTGDVGYAAQNTLAGSRMNTALRDTPTPISVYTAQFISDIGVDSMEEVLEYSVNMTPELSDQDGTFGANQLTAFDARYRVRGLDAGSARNYFETRLDQDVFNVERIDESRGPNSILFGLGLPGGVLNTSTKKPRYVDFTTLDITVGDADRFRTSIDVNRVVVEDKLAIRFNALYNENGVAGRPSDHVYREDKRYHLAVQWRATESTTINVEWEHGDVVDSPHQPFGPSDRASLWVTNGRRAAGEGIGADQGIGGSYGTTRVTYIDNSGSIVDVRGQSQTNNPAYTRSNHFTNDNNLINDPSKTGVVEVPIFAAVNGPWHMRGERDIDMITANIEQRLGENTFFEFVFAQYDYKRPTFRLGANNHLFGDPNPTNRDGSPNPFFGELFFEAQLEFDDRSWKDEWLRASLSHEQDFENLLGRHRLAAMWETQDGRFNRNSFANAWNDPNVTFGGPFHAVPYNGRNRVYYRHYLTDLDNINDWRVGNDPARSGRGFSFTTEDGRSLESTFVQNRSNRNSREIDSIMIAGQSFFWDDRIVATYGFREDDFLNISPPHFRNDVDNQRTENDFDNASITSLSGESTETYGVAFHVTDQITLMANKANNAGLSAFAERTIMGAAGEQRAAVPVPAGESEDFGVMLELMDGRLVITGSVYETVSTRESSFPSWNVSSEFNGNAIAGINNIYDNLATGDPYNGIDPFITEAVNDNQRTEGGLITTSNSSEGWELTATANITENWRFTANASYIDSTIADTFSEFTPWWEGPTGKPFFQQFDQNFVFPDDGPFEPGVTLGEAIALVEEGANSVQRRAGGTSVGQRHEKFNLFTNYSFTEGVLENFSIGGGARYRSGATYIQTSPLGQVEFGGMTLLDLVAGYDTEMFGIPVQFQLNIRNLADKENVSVVRLSNSARPDGGYEVFKYVHTVGRDIRLRARFRF